jgi:hypothetical protein
VIAKHPRSRPPGRQGRGHLPTDLVPILDDLRVGLRRRAARRRRARAGAATALTSLLLAGVGITTAGRMADAGAAGPPGAALVLYGCAEGLACWPDDVNLPKHRSYRDR